jgi:hypothetical protein
VNKPARRLLLAAGLVVAAFLVIALLRTPANAPVMPKPNGYDLLISAGRKVIDSSEYKDLDRPGLAALVASNATALTEARESFKFESRVPFAPAETQSNGLPQLGKHLEELSAFKRLGFAFCAEGDSAQAEQRPSDALRSCLDLLEVARVAGRGGPMMDAMVGLSVETMAVRQAEFMLPSLPVTETRQLAACFESFDRNRDTYEKTMENEDRWVRAVYGLKGSFVRLVTGSMLKKGEQGFLTKLQAQQQRTRILSVRAAAQAFELERGAKPRIVQDLVPDYLKSVPLDPVTGREIEGVMP